MNAFGAPPAGLKPVGRSWQERRSWRERAVAVATIAAPGGTVVTQSLLTSQRAIDQSIRPTSDGDSGWCPESNKRRTSVGHESNKSRTRVEQERKGAEGRGRREGGKEGRRNGGTEERRALVVRAAVAVAVLWESRPCHDRVTTDTPHNTPTARQPHGHRHRWRAGFVRRPRVTSHESSRVITSRHESS